MADHAFLSPSASHRWLNCTAAPELESREPDQTSVFAEEGTLAHAICEAKLRAFRIRDNSLDCFPHPSGEELFETEHGINWTEDHLYQEEMEDTSDYYANEVINTLQMAKITTPDAKLLIEERVDILPELFGTVDAMIIADDVMHVFDYKHGKGVKVSAEMNPQMMIYGIGAILKYEDFYNIRKVRMTIVQPRIGNTSTFEMSADDLMLWSEKVLIPTAKEILSGEVPIQKAGSWCKFCKVKGKCQELARMAEDVKSKSEDPRLLTLSEISELLPKIDTIKIWCDAITSYALDQALGGEELPGYKLVEGRSKRVINNEESLVRMMTEAGFTEDVIYKPRELQSITALEKTVGKKTFNEQYGEFITKQMGKPTLTTSDDKRPAIERSAQADFKDIKIEE